MASKKTVSPWIEQLKNDRPIRKLRQNIKTDVVIIGAGIAGVTTAYYLLKNTRVRVVLVEAKRVASGATGHNAGQLVSYSERGFADIADEFGLEMAADGQRAIDSTWDLIDQIRDDLQIETPLLTFNGYAGLIGLDEILIRLKDNQAREKAGLESELMYIADNFKSLKRIPRSLKKFYRTTSHEAILSALQTNDSAYVAMLSSKKGCMNSALFCEEIIEKITARYSHRFSLYEQSPVKKVHLYKNHAQLAIGNFSITSKRVILCTNGFERFRIHNHAGADIDAKFHHLVRGSVGYMAAFKEEPPLQPTAISYLPLHLDGMTGSYDADPYYYITRRPLPGERGVNLVCIGGPEVLMDDTNDYKKDHPFPMEAKKMIDRFVKETYIRTGHRFTYSHLWHGLMGYTPNGIRRVGEEPCNPVLLYNLGCNGVGILASVYGAFRISTIIRGDALKPSIFDPHDQSCEIGVHAKPIRRSPAFGWVTATLLISFSILVYLLSLYLYLNL